MITGTGENVFGRTPGEHDFVVVLASDSEALDEIQGRTLAEATAKKPRGAQIIPFTIVYEVAP